MAEETSAPKKEKPSKAASVADGAAASPAGAPVEKKGKGPKGGDKAAKPAADGTAAPAGSPAPAPAKPVEMVGGVAKQPTAEDLLKEELGTIKDHKGQVIAWSTAGKCNFRGSRKSTAYAAQIVAQDAARNAMSHGLKDIVIRVSGPGLGRDSAIRALQAIGLEITSIVDVTPIPHNGCRPRKRRRV